MIGTLLCGRYRLEDQIGSGGMSTVFRAFDETLERWVAIKVLHGALLDDPLQLERFRREARTVARLSHPHIVTVIDAGEDDGQPFIVLEYVDGETLKARVRRLGRLGVIESIGYAMEVGRALTAAHERRLVHRDVKPQNVLIDGDGRAKVTDFGISRSLEDEGLTATGRVLGTTDYVAPEQALGDCTCEQSDVYSLGVCLYEMLTGSVPFKADSQVGVAMKHVREPLPDVRSARPEVSAALAAVVERATAKERGNRYVSAAAMVADLQQALAVETARAAGASNGERTTVLPAVAATNRHARAPRTRRRRLRAVAIAAVAAVAIAAVVTLTLGTRAANDTARSSPPPATALHAIKLSSANAYNPYGDDSQHADMAANAIDGDATTFWQTDDYSAGGGLGSKPGVGIYVQAQSPVAARRLDVTTATPGASVEVFASNAVPGRIEGWGRPLGHATLGQQTHIALTGGGRHTTYLLWITKLPPQNQAQVAEIRLLG